MITINLNLNNISLDLVAQHRAGDKEAIKRLCKIHERFIFWAANRYSYGIVEKADAISEAWVCFLEKTETLPLPATGSFMGYVAPAIRGRLMRLAQKSARFNIEHDLCVDDISDADLEHQVLLTQLSKAISDLPKQEQEVLVARYRQGDRQKDVAASLGISQPRACQIEASAISKLKKVLNVV